MVFYSPCRGGGMVDTRDLKSLGRKAVWVRLPPAVPAVASSSHIIDGVTAGQPKLGEGWPFDIF